MFDLSAKRLVWIPIEWPGLVQASPDTLAQPTTHRIEMQVELLDKEQLDAINDRYNDGRVGDAPAEQRAIQRDIELSAMKEIAHAWRGVSAGGAPVPFDDANMARMIQVPGFSVGFNAAYQKAMLGQIEVREKNSAGSPASGPAAE